MLYFVSFIFDLILYQDFLLRLFNLNSVTFPQASKCPSRTYLCKDLWSFFLKIETIFFLKVNLCVGICQRTEKAMDLDNKSSLHRLIWRQKSSHPKVMAEFYVSEKLFLQAFPQCPFLFSTISVSSWDLGNITQQI